MIVPWSPFGDMPPGQGFAGEEKEAHKTYPSAGASIGVFKGIK